MFYHSLAEASIHNVALEYHDLSSEKLIGKSTKITIQLDGDLAKPHLRMQESFHQFALQITNKKNQYQQRRSLQ